tara:strand:- start:1413 stop:2060 length:648 start_codon:yes stop_codon:yes gene_type:complete
MKKDEIIKALQEARKNAKKRNFSQTIELIIGFKGLDLKKPDHQLDFYMQVKHPWKETKVCGLVAEELLESSKKALDNTIFAEEFLKYKEKKVIKKLAREYDFFVAQANLMPKVAQTFGRYFGPINKMPNPKSGCVVPPNANLEALKARLNRTIRIFVKIIPLLQLGVAKEESKDEDIADDILAIYDQTVHHLPAEQQNVKSVYVKLTMGKAVKIQ